MKDKILKQLQEQKISSKPGFRIYFENELLVMNSGKYNWNKSGEAKNALIRSMKDTIPEWVSTYMQMDNLNNSLNELLETGIIKIEYYDTKS